MGEGKERIYPRITREQIRQAFRLGFEAVASLIEYQQDLIEDLGQRIKALEDQQHKDSHNSSKPPSSDGIGRRAYPPRKKSEKRPGGQLGHEGSTLKRVRHPDRITIHAVTHCEHCGVSLKNKRPRGLIRRQVFDLPEIKMNVEEHRAEIKGCDHCGHLTIGQFPTSVGQPVQYGPRIQAIGLYLRNYGLVPFARASEMFKDLFGVCISAGTLASIEQRASRTITGVVQQIKERILDAKVRHHDETGFSNNGKIAWLHAASTGNYSYFMPHLKRGEAATEDMGILGHGVPSIMVHDNWATYFKYKGLHALCNAHQGRELKFVEEEYIQPWAKKMLDLLLKGKEEVRQAKEAGRKRLSEKVILSYTRWYKPIIAEGMKANPPPSRDEGSGLRGRIKRSKARNLVERLDRLREETLMYLSDFSVPYDNNLVERDLRMMKVQQKISGTFRSWKGVTAFCHIRSLISTMKKNSASVFDGLCRIFDSRPLTLPLCLQKA